MRTRNIAIGIILVFTLALGSFWLGFREGVKVGLLVDAVPRGSISLYQLENLKQGQLTQNVTTGLESDIDVALLCADLYEHHPLYQFLESAWGLPVSSAERSLGRLANYRKFNLSPLRAEALGSEPRPTDPQRAAERQELLYGAEQTDLVIGRVVQKYATKSGTPSP